MLCYDSCIESLIVVEIMEGVAKTGDSRQALERAFRSQWSSPSEKLALGSDEVHVWVASLDQPDTRLQGLSQTLSDDESSRAKRFHFAGYRRRFVARRGMLRIILGRYMGIDPRQLEFCYGSYGKPFLAKGFGDDSLMFNLSHSHEKALYGFTRSRRIGVDLEYIHSMPDIEPIVARFFSTHENAEFRSLQANQRQEAFFRCWTGKEAFLKALGDGLSRSLDQVDIALGPGTQLRLRSVQWSSEEAAHWSLESLTPIPEFAAALAVEGSGWCLSTFVWQGE